MHATTSGQEKIPMEKIFANALVGCRTDLLLADLPFLGIADNISCIGELYIRVIVVRYLTNEVSANVSTVRLCSVGTF